MIDDHDRILALEKQVAEMVEKLHWLMKTGVVLGDSVAILDGRLNRHSDDILGIARALPKLE